MIENKYIIEDRLSDRVPARKITRHVNIGDTYIDDNEMKFTTDETCNLEKHHENFTPAFGPSSTTPTKRGYTDVIQVYCESTVTGHKWTKFYAAGQGLVYIEGNAKSFGGDFYAFVEHH